MKTCGTRIAWNTEEGATDGSSAVPESNFLVLVAQRSPEAKMACAQVTLVALCDGGSGL